MNADRLVTRRSPRESRPQASQRLELGQRDPADTSPTRWIARLAPLLALACSCSAPLDPPDWTTPVPHDRATAQKSNPSTNDLVIYLDVSRSMAGYVRTSGDSVFGKSLRELRNVSTILTPTVEIAVRRVARSVSSPVRDVDLLARASRDGSFYDGSDTDLAGAFGIFERPVRQAGEDEDPLPPARLHVLVTDGVQSTSSSGGDPNCLSGSDQICVRRQVQQLISKGWSGIVLGVRSEFHGTLFSEVARAAGRPSAIAYDSRDSKPETHRPFYFYVFSPDGVALDDFVSQFGQRLEAAGISGIRIFPLTRSYVKQPATIESISKPDDEVIEVFAEQDPPRERFTLFVDLATEHSEPAQLELQITPAWSNHARGMADPAELARLVTWQIERISNDPGLDSPAADTVRTPQLTIVDSAEVGADGRARLKLAAKWPAAVGEPSWQMFRLEGHIDFQAATSTPGWVRDWSTDLDNTPASANRTLFLETQFLALWRDLQTQTVGEAWLRVGPK